MLPFEDAIKLMPIGPARYDAEVHSDYCFASSQSPVASLETQAPSQS